MDGYSEKIPLIVIAGATACGKTATAIEVAKQTDGEIISADSMQIYKGLDIGTAKPTEEEQSEVRHHLINIKSPDELYSVADFVADANGAIDDIISRGKQPIVCGGTGLYISSLVSGLTFAEDKTDMVLRKSLFEEYEKNGIKPFLNEITQKDPDYAKTLHPNNVKRILRAVERLRSTGLCDEEQNELSQRNPSRLNTFYFVLAASERESLYKIIETRIDKMIELGLCDEALRVYNNKDCYKTAAQAIGYKELFGYFEGTSTLSECVALLKQATRRYAKRQITWFKREKNAEWLYTDILSSREAAQTIVTRFQNL